MKNDDRWQQADQWLERALALPAHKRAALMSECPDEEVRAQVLKLIELAERSDGMFAPGAPIAQWDEAEAREALGIAPGFAVGHRLLDRYELADKVGQGAMGAVFRARDTKLDRDVAVKVVTGPGIDAKACERLLREARAAAALNHPHVVAIHDVGEQDGKPFFVMELVEGATLETEPPSDIGQIVATARQICSALEHAHSRGVVHRDLKPSNVLIVDAERGRVVKLVDLGLALARDSNRLTAEGQVLGTPSYMAPEQALGNDVDGRADLYALGIMMYQWATGELPFAGDDALAVISQHINARVVPPRTRAPDLPAELDAIITRLLAKDPAERFGNAADLAAALGALTGTDDTVDTLQFRAATRGEPMQRINRRLTGASQLPPMYGREKFLETVANAVRRLMKSGSESSSESGSESGAEDAGGSVGHNEVQRHGNCVTCNGLLLPESVRVHLAMGRHDRAQEAAARLEATADKYGSRAWVAMARHARGRCLLATGELAKAETTLKEAEEAYAEYGDLYEAARCRVARALAISEPERQSEVAAPARETLKRLGTERVEGEVSNFI